MTTYIRIRSADGSNAVMIDDTFRNLELATSGTASTSAAWSPSALRVATITVSGRSDPVVAIASTTACALLYRTNNGGGSFTFKIIFNTTSDISFSYYIYDNPDNSAPLLYMVVRDANNNVIFNAGEKYMRVVGVMNTPVPPGTGTTSTSTAFTSGKTYAVLLGHSGMYIRDVVGVVDPGGGSLARWQEDVSYSAQMSRVVGNTVYTDYVEVYEYSQGGVGALPPHGGGTFGQSIINNLVLDVTNF